MNTTQELSTEVGVGLMKISIDMHQRNFRVVRQLDYSAPQPAQKFTPEQFYHWLEKQLQLAERVVVAYEAGCFGYGPARRMKQMGAEVLVIAPQNWDEQGKRQVNDKFDAQMICLRMSEYLNGHKRALTVVRVPTAEEEQRRAKARLRGQLRKELRRMQAMGRGLLLSQGKAVSGQWWKERTWEQIVKEMSGWVVEALTLWKELVEAIEAKAEKVEAELRAAAPKEKLFVGEGALTHELFERELIDPHRFKNARQVGNYFGMCPSESTSDGDRRQGSITKHGNPRLRQIIIELAWRVVFFQPEYRGVKKWAHVLKNKAASASAKKKAIVALGRQLAVDIWRVATGKVSAEALGLKMVVPLEEPACA
ncbi:IS110 family RNA-guided transposase [Verrucomicrobiota bacterium sgz303538]